MPPGFPTIDMGPQLKVVERSRTATMLCAASGNPDPEITWFKDFLPVNTSNNNGRIKQLRSGDQCLFTPLPPQTCLLFAPRGFSPSSLGSNSLLVKPLPWYSFLNLFSTYKSLFLPLFGVAVALSSCRGYWLRLSAAPLTLLLLLYELTVLRGRRFFKALKRTISL